LLAALAATIGGCSTAEKRYRVLSFFFDGVPDPNAPPGSASATGSGEGGTAQTVKVVSWVHKPYADGKCSECHGGNVNTTSSFESFQKVGSDVCLKCHKAELQKFTVMHGPVTAGECLLCHAPHESTVHGMLNDNAPAVCAKCHDRELLSSKPPEHQLPNSQCLQCHVGHGGPKHNLLRIDATIPKLRIPPATQKSNVPPTAASLTPADPPPGGAGT
jgi:predicted CXXCH cytochrome family protein